MRTNDVLATLSAIRHGLRVERLPALAGDSFPELMHYDAAPVLPRLSLWLLTLADIRRANRIHVFNAYLSEHIMQRLTSRNHVPAIGV